MVSHKTLLMTGSFGFVLSLSMLILYSIYTYTAFGFILALMGMIASATNIYLGYVPL